MHAQRPDGVESLYHGTQEELAKKLEEAQQEHPGTTGKVFKQGETIEMNNGYRFKVTKHGLQVATEKKKRDKNRKSNKAARRARGKARR